MKFKFEMSDAQQARLEAWFNHHWSIVHKDFRPRGDSPIWYHVTIGRTGVGDNVKVNCHWCLPGHQGHEVDLTEDDDGELIFQYDENWNRLPASWEQGKTG